MKETLKHKYKKNVTYIYKGKERRKEGETDKEGKNQWNNVNESKKKGGSILLNYMTFPYGNYASR